MKVWEQTEWFKNLKDHEYVYIFGAGAGALQTLNCIRNVIDKKIEGYVVSDLSKNPETLSGYPVYALDNINLHHNGLIIMSTAMEKNQQIEEVLRQAGFSDIIPSACQMRDTTYCLKNDLLLSSNIVSQLAEKPIIYIVTSHLNQHKMNVEFGIKCAEYIQAGATLTEKVICAKRDNIGEENISEQNPWYCELSAGYWIWKNDTVHDWIGLFHYSRGLDLNDTDIKAIMNSNIDVVLPALSYRPQALVSALHRIDIEIISHALDQEELKLFEDYLQGNYFVRGNIFFAKAFIYQEYYAWLMDVLKRCEEYCKQKNIAIVKRVWGYYGEHLLNVYFKKKKYKITYCNMKTS